ncbi:MAG: YfhO family protein, partial [Planctomycetaceae bacterium]
PGWHATIDGENQPTQTDGEFLSVEVPAGQHRVEWRYAPASVRWGGCLSLIAWSGLLVAAGVGLGRQRMREFSRTGADARPAG